MNFDRLKTAAAAVMLSVAIAATAARPDKGFQVFPSGPCSLQLTVDSIDYRSDLTRVYGKLKGTPHTSNRIDELTLSVPAGDTYESTDIDGVDMQRWFQWEDDGLIMVEIDFPAIKKVPRAFVIEAKGPKGASKWNVRKTSKR